MNTETPKITPAQDEPGSNACTVGFISRRDGQATHAVVEKALFAKAQTFHRAGYAVDGKTSDGDGIETQLPQQYFSDRYNELKGDQLGDHSIAVGQVWLPRSKIARERAQAIITEELNRAGLHGSKWRKHGLIDPEYMGQLGRERMPHLAQILIPLESRATLDVAASEKNLTIIREEIMHRLREEGLVGRDPETCHFTSFSGERIIYTARSDPKDHGKFFPDLQHPDYASVWAKIHGRFTTAGDTKIANIQPLPGGVAHNGTIVTDRGAANNMKIHERRIANILGPRSHSMLPLMQSGASDSANLSRVKEALEHTGLSLPAIKMMLLAKAESDGRNDSAAVKDTKRFLDAAMEKYDGPALVIMTNGRQILATLDANGLRPAMIEETGEYFALGSEFGMWGFDIKNELLATGELDRGCMLMFDSATGKVSYDKELQEQVAQEFQFKDWASYVEDFKFDEHSAEYEREYRASDLSRRMRLAGYSQEDVTKMLAPMVRDAMEPKSSMGNLTRAAGFSDQFHPASHFYNEAHVQIVAPPHDSELDPDVMNLHGYSAYPLDAEGKPRHIVRVPDTYVLSRDMLNQFREKIGDEKFKVIVCTFDVNAGEGAYNAARQRIAQEAIDAAREGKHIILTDETVGRDRAPLYMTHAMGTVNAALLNAGLRGDVSVTVKDAYAHTSHEAKILKECGANFVVPYLAEEIILDMQEKGAFRDKAGNAMNVSKAEAVNRWLGAINGGVLVANQRTGTMRASSSQGAHQFSVYGMDRKLVNEVHPGVASPISGLEEGEIQRRITEHHRQTYKPTPLETLAIVSSVDGKVQLAPGGRFGRTDAEGEIHSQDKMSVDYLHEAVRAGTFEKGEEAYRRYSDYVHARGQHYGIFARDHLSLRYADQPIPLEEVESEDKLFKRLVTGAMSVGSISSTVHRDLHGAINRLPKDPDTGEGAQSNTGEGGYPEALLGTDLQPAVVQWSTAAFGIRPQLLKTAKVIEFKFGQGAKTGMGGKLDGEKVNEEIAANRFVQPGTTLNSPPQHADMMSIEDLKQVIKKALSVNPAAEIRIKIVAKDGCEHDAVGAAKAMRNAVDELKHSIPGISGKMSILLAGNAGGTGNAPVTAIQYSGEPWEPYLPIVSKALHDNHFREDVKLIVDGGMRSGKDMVYAAGMGADVSGFGTTFLYSLGCLNQGQCQTGKCAAAIATTDGDLIRNFYLGKPEHVERYARYMIRELREEMAKLGVRSYDELVGADIFENISPRRLNLDFSFLHSANVEGQRPRYKYKPAQDHLITNPSIDAQIIQQKPDVLQGGGGTFNFKVDNTAVATGANIAGELALHILGKTRDYNEQVIDNDLVVNLEGTPGYATASLLTQKMRFNISGIAGDSLGVHNRGGIITVVPPEGSKLSQSQQDNILAGNLANGYSTGGESYIAGLAGHGASFRQSGGTHVYQGTRSRAGQFKTGGTFIAWQSGVGMNSFAKHSGGEAFVRDEGKSIAEIVGNFNNEAMKTNYCRPLSEDTEAQARLKAHLETTYAYTQDPKLGRLLERFDEAVSEFVHVIPRKKAAANTNIHADPGATPVAAIGG
jgi:glutamate synthase (NADPH/NADH) large chain